MSVLALVKDKSLESKEKTEQLAAHILSNSIFIDELIAYASTAKDSEYAICMEAAEHATRLQPSLAGIKLLDFAINSLQHKAPRVKWESAKVIGNIAHVFSKKLDKAIPALLINTEDKGTVVRWSAAFALGEIVKLNASYNKELLPAIEKIVNREEKNSIRKIYLSALKQAKA